MTDKTDPVDELARGIAADHTLEKARRAPGDEAGEPAAAEPTAAREPSFVGDFATYDEVRAFALEENHELTAGDLTVVNGTLARYRADGMFETVVDSLLDMFAPVADHTERFSRDLENIERVVLAAEFESGPLLGNFRDVVLAMFKGKPKAWTEMSQMEQRDLAKQVEGHCATLIRKVARVIAEGEEISVAGKLESFNCKGGFDLKISAPGDADAVVELFKMVGHEVVIMSADSQRFLDNVAPAAEIADEPPLPFADLEPGEDVLERDPRPEDDSDLAGEPDEEDEDGDSDEDEVEEVEADPAEEGDGPGDYETRTNPDDEPGEDDVDEAPAEMVDPAKAADDFSEATPEELAAQKSRQPAEEKPAADYVGPKEPTEAVPGESWQNTADDRIRWKHPNGKFYLSAPTEDAMTEWRNAEEAKAKAATGDDFPDDPA